MHIRINAVYPALWASRASLRGLVGMGGVEPLN